MLHKNPYTSPSSIPSPHSIPSPPKTLVIVWSGLVLTTRSTFFSDYQTREDHVERNPVALFKLIHNDQGDPPTTQLSFRSIMEDASIVHGFYGKIQHELQNIIIDIPVLRLTEQSPYELLKRCREYICLPDRVSSVDKDFYEDQTITHSAKRKEKLRSLNLFLPFTAVLRDLNELLSGIPYF